MSLQDIIATYNSIAAAYPHLTTIGTALVTFPLGNIISQTIANRNKPKEERAIDWKSVGYTAALAPVYGAGIDAIVQSTAIPQALGIEDPLQQTMTSVLPLSHAFNAAYFVNNSVGQESGYSLKALGSFYRNITKREGKAPQTVLEGVRNIVSNIAERIDGTAFTKAAIGVQTFWYALYAANGIYVNPENRGPLALAASVPWNTLISYLSTRTSNSAE